MADSFEKLKELNLSRDEVNRIGEALKKEEFRKLLNDYVEEVQDPANKKLYEQEITQLEAERGVDVTFIHPEPGYVVKTSVDGRAKCFLNVCHSARVQPPSSAPGRDAAGARGLQWALPHSLTPPRDDADARGARCRVFDVVFHPDALHLAARHRAFRRMLTRTACEAVEAGFGVTLDQANLKFPRMAYKGLARASVVRTPSAEHRPSGDPAEREFLAKLYEQADEQAKKYPKRAKKAARKVEDYTAPSYVIRHRSHVDLQEFVEDKSAKMNAATPRELIVEVDLPLLKSSGDIVLDVTEKTVQLVSEKPSKYKLSLTLPYRVNQDSGSAKFDKDHKKLIITLPVRRAQVEVSTSRDDSGVESDHSPVEVAEPVRKVREERTHFLEASIAYCLPEFTCHLYERLIAFTINVKNVSTESIQQKIEDTSLHIKFTSISSSFHQVHYAFYVKLTGEVIDQEKVSVEIWDNNLVLQVPCDQKLESFFYGVNANDLKEKYLEEPSVLNSVLANTIPEDEILEFATEETNQSKAINILGTSYESSGDELSCSCSPSKGKGILKRLANRRLVGRSISESDLDDVCSSVDSALPEDSTEMSTSLKKTVRFNDVIHKQLFRSNSSILGQKKKNQRKSKNKKRAHERRHSESEASEGDERKEDKDKDETEEDGDEDAHNIFDMDINWE